MPIIHHEINSSHLQKAEWPEKKIEQRTRLALSVVFGYRFIEYPGGSQVTPHCIYYCEVLAQLSMGQTA